jgi:MFS family permease
MGAPSSTDWGLLFRNRAFLYLFSARTIAQFGNTFGAIALIWYVYAKTGSPIALTLVGLAEIVPLLGLGLFSGALVDRYERRRTTGASALGRGAAMGILIASVLLLGFNLAVVLAVVVGFSIVSTFMGPASTALLPQIVAKDEISRANGVIQAAGNTVAIIGMSMAGVLIALVGVLPALTIDAVSFVVSGAMVLMISSRAISVSSSAASNPSSSLWKEVADGIRYLRSQVALLELTLSALSLNFFATLSGLFVVVYVTQVLKGGSLMFGAVNAVDAAGLAIGSLIVGPTRLTRFTGRLWAIAGIVFGAFLGLLVIVPLSLPTGWDVFLAIGIIYLGFGLFGGAIGTAWLSTAQAVVPEEFQGRYFALDNLGSFAATPAAQVTGGLLTSARGILTTYAVSAAGCAVFGGFFVTRKELRSLSYDPGKAPVQRAESDRLR